jgi:hypothetical protein
MMLSKIVGASPPQQAWSVEGKEILLRRLDPHRVRRRDHTRKRTISRCHAGRRLPILRLSIAPAGFTADVSVFRAHLPASPFCSKMLKVNWVVWGSSLVGLTDFIHAYSAQSAGNVALWQYHVPLILRKSRVLGSPLGIGILGFVISLASRM